MPEEDPTAERYFQAALELLNEAAEIGELFTVEKVAQKAGVSVQAVNQKFRGAPKEQLVNGTIRYMTRTSRFNSVEAISAALTELAQAAEPASALKQFCHDDLTLVRDDPVNRGLLLLMGAKPDTFITTALVNLYLGFDVLTAPLIGAVIRAWNREPTPPLNLEHLATMFNSIVDGVAMRGRFDPDHGTPELYHAAVICLIPRVTRRIGDTTTLADYEAEIDSY